MSGAARLARVIASLGAGTIARAWHRASRTPGRAIVLMYHRISDEPDYLGMTVAPAVFARQLELLCKRVRVVALADLAAQLADATPLAEDVAAITFDDGYRDNLEHALPALQAHGVPATVFVSTGFVDRTAYPAGAHLREAYEALWRRGMPSGSWEGQRSVDALVRAALAEPGSLPAVAGVRRALKELPAADAEHVVAALEALAGVPARSRDLMLDWGGVRALAAAGIEIGSHAVSHRILARMDRAQAEEEIRDSKTRLEAEIGRPVRGFAFPNGRRGDFLPEHAEMLRRSGYAYACTGETGSNRPGADVYQLRRIGVGNDSGALLDLKLALGRAA